MREISWRSRRAAAGRAQLLVKKGASGRVQLQAIVSGSRPLSAPLGTRRPCASTLARAESGKLDSRKILQKNRQPLQNLKFQQISDFSKFA